MDQNTTREGLHECVVSTIPGHRQRKHRTEHRQGHTPSLRIKIKISDLAGNRTRATRLLGADGRNESSAWKLITAYTIHAIIAFVSY